MNYLELHNFIKWLQKETGVINDLASDNTIEASCKRYADIMSAKSGRPVVANAYKCKFATLTLGSRLNFGKYKGRTFQATMETDIDYVNWLLSEKAILMDSEAYKHYCDITDVIPKVIPVDFEAEAEIEKEIQERKVSPTRTVSDDGLDLPDISDDGMPF